MYETFVRRAGPFLAIVIVAIGLIAVLPGVAERSGHPDDGMSRSMLILPGDVVATSDSPVWNRMWGGSKHDVAQAVWGDGAGSVYMCGYTASFGASIFDIVLVKWNAAGNQLWNRMWGGAAQDYGYSVWGDGMNVYTCGSTRSFGAGNDHIFLVKWDAAGNQLWNRAWGGMSDEQGYSIWGNGTDIYLCGSTTSFGLCTVLIKWDAAGNQLWNRTWSATDSITERSVWGDGQNIYVSDNRYGMSSSGVQSLDMALVKLDAAGNQLWNRTWGGEGSDYGLSVWGDGMNIYTCGSTRSIGAGDSDIVLVKWDSNGNQLWNSTWGGNIGEAGMSVWGGGTNVFVCGITVSFGAGNWDLVLVKWDAAGNLLWNQTWGTTSNDYGYSVWCNETSVYACGLTYGFGNGEMVLMKWTNTLPTNQAPNITHPADITYTVGQAGNILSWTIMDANTSTRTYTIYRNGTSIVSGSWISGTPVTRNVDGLAAGWHNFTIIATDGFGESVQDYVVITINPNIPPVITHPTDITFTAGQNGNVISWTITDATTSMRAYTILRNGTLIANGSWTSGTPVTLDVDGLTEGPYIYTINATDGLGESAQDSAIITVIPNTAPRIICTISKNYSVITWTINDTSTGTSSFTLYRNGAVVANGTWTAGVPVNASTSGLTTGAYNFTIVVDDGLGGHARSSAIVVVVAHPPGHGDPVDDGAPNYVIIIVIIFTAGATLATAFSIIKYRARVIKGGGSIGALSTKNSNDVVVEKPYPTEDLTKETLKGGVAERTPEPATMPVMATPSAAHPSAAAICTRCGNARAPDNKQGKYCGYCGEPFTRIS